MHVHASGLATVAVCDREYPARVAFSVLRAVHDEFVARHSRTWEGATGPLAFPGLEGIIRRYQKPDGTGKATKEAQSWIMWAAIVVLLGVLFKLVSGGNLIVTPPPKPEL